MQRVTFVQRYAVSQRSDGGAEVARGSVEAYTFAFPIVFHKYHPMNGTITNCVSLLADIGGFQAWIRRAAAGHRIGFAVVNVAASSSLSSRPVRKEENRERMVPIGDTRKRFNVRSICRDDLPRFRRRIVFMYPWATIFAKGVEASHTTATRPSAVDCCCGNYVFVVLLVAYFYAWGKGVSMD